MSEKEPQINLKIGTQEFQLRRDNSELYTYLAQACFNHIFLQDDEDEEVRRGTFIPREFIGHEAFDMIADAMIDNGYPSHVNLHRLTDSDAEIITKILLGKVEDTLPEDWDEV